MGPAHQDLTVLTVGPRSPAGQIDVRWDDVGAAAQAGRPAGPPHLPRPASAALQPRPAVTVVLTDGYTPWPPDPPKGMRVAVGLLGERAPQAPPWARSVRVERG